MTSRQQEAKTLVSRATKEKETADNTGTDPFTMMKSLRDSKTNSESGSSNGGGSNSDNSALVSFGNASFGFNFDSEEGNSSPPNSDQNEDSSGSEGAKKRATKGPKHSAAAAPSMVTDSSGGSSGGSSSKLREQTSSSEEGTSEQSGPSEVHRQKAETASHSLKSLAHSVMNRKGSKNSSPPTKVTSAPADTDRTSRKRKASGRAEEESIGGYNSDDDDEMADSSTRSASKGDDEPGHGKRKKRMDEKKREERNAREKERSFRISKQINELRDLLSSGGVIVPKGTKSSVLTEAANYIRMLQQHQYRSEIDRHQLIQQMQLIGGGAHGPQAAAAIRHIAAQNGVWSLGNFGGVPPKSAMTFYEPGAADPSTVASAAPATSASGNMDQQDGNSADCLNVGVPDYRYVFNSCGVGMAIASMGGAFIDCNQLFTKLSNYSKQELCSLTIFNLTARTDLQQAFDLISQMISPPMDAAQDTKKPVILRGAMKDRSDLGLSINLVKGEDGIAKCFCVTLIKNPSSPFDLAQPIAATFDSIEKTGASASDKQEQAANSLNDSTPTFTSG